MRLVSPPSTADTVSVWRATGLERQVFLDEAGRRRRLVLALGVFAAVATAAWLVLLIGGALSFAAFRTADRLPPAKVVTIAHR